MNSKDKCEDILFFYVLGLSTYVSDCSYLTILICRQTVLFNLLKLMIRI